MNIDFLEDMVNIALKHKAPKETAFSNIELQQETVRLGCIRILEWLRIQSVTLQKKSLNLKTTSKIDVSCLLLIEATDFLHESLEINNGYLTFSKNITIDQAKTMMIYARENYCPPVLIHKSIKRKKKETQ